MRTILVLTGFSFLWLSGCHSDGARFPTGGDGAVGGDAEVRPDSDLTVVDDGGSSGDALDSEMVDAGLGTDVIVVSDGSPPSWTGRWSITWSLLTMRPASCGGRVVNVPKLNVDLALSPGTATWISGSVCGAVPCTSSGVATVVGADRAELPPPTTPTGTSFTTKCDATLRAPDEFACQVTLTIVDFQACEYVMEAVGVKAGATPWPI